MNFAYSLLSKVIFFILFVSMGFVSFAWPGLPGKTKAIMKISSLQSLTDNWQAYLNQASDIEFNINLENYISKGYQLKSLEGVNRNQPLWAVYSEFSSGDQPVAAFFPLQDESLFRDQLPPDRLTVTIQDEYALISENEHAIELHKWYENGGNLDELQKILPDAENEIQLWGNLNTLFDDYQKFLKENLFDQIPKAKSKGTNTKPKDSPFSLLSLIPSNCIWISLLSSSKSKKSGIPKRTAICILL